MSSWCHLKPIRVAASYYCTFLILILPLAAPSPKSARSPSLLYAPSSPAKITTKSNSCSMKGHFCSVLPYIVALVTGAEKVDHKVMELEGLLENAVEGARIAYDALE